MCGGHTHNNSKGCGLGQSGLSCSRRQTVTDLLSGCYGIWEVLSTIGILEKTNTFCNG
jgi:hypothetical protein